MFSLRALIRNLLFTQAINTSTVPKVQNLTDREISWLAFNQRVLELAEDKSIPLLERVRFLTIFLPTLMSFTWCELPPFCVKLKTISRR